MDHNNIITLVSFIYFQGIALIQEEVRNGNESWEVVRPLSQIEDCSYFVWVDEIEGQ
ncbi:uncharacterized protein DS421_20g682420 [Arachis hypogaea]|nr:uncharacterized protein DS421_20g682420 [Arachis hypogaea]